MLQDQRAVGNRVVQPGADREATGARIRPGLGQNRDNPHVGLEGRQNAQRCLAVGLVEQPQRIRVVISCIGREPVDIGGHDGLKVGPAPILTSGRLQMNDAGDKNLLRRLRPHRIRTWRNETGGEFASVLLDAAIGCHIPDQRSPVMGSDKQGSSLRRKTAHHVALGVEHQHAVLAGNCFVDQVQHGLGLAATDAAKNQKVPRLALAPQRDRWHQGDALAVDPGLAGASSGKGL
jgi:hypothetical protein